MGKYLNSTELECVVIYLVAAFICAVLVNELAFQRLTLMGHTVHLRCFPQGEKTLHLYLLFLGPLKHGVLFVCTHPSFTRGLKQGLMSQVSQMGTTGRGAPEAAWGECGHTCWAMESMEREEECSGLGLGNSAPPQPLVRPSISKL